jgi:hypothetical protein
MFMLMSDVMFKLILPLLVDRSSRLGGKEGGGIIKKASLNHRHREKRWTLPNTFKK